MITDQEWQERMERLMAEYEVDRNLEIFQELVTDTTRINTWTEFQDWCEPFKRNGCFRGQRDATWHLDTTFYRKVYRKWSQHTEEYITETVDLLHPEENELALLKEFQRAAHHYYSSIPDLDQTIDWMALMQHHGAPTRMLDWTHSPYVALYFAMQEGAAQEAALWAIDWTWLQERSSELLREHDTGCPSAEEEPNRFAQYVNHILLKTDNPYVIVPASPKQINERMLIQQGELLCNLRHRPAFSTILLSMLIHPAKVQRRVISKVFVNRDRRVQFLEELKRMNIHDASLFPGLDGFARSLGVNLDIYVENQIEERKDTFLEYLKTKAAKK